MGQRRTTIADGELTRRFRSLLACHSESVGKQATRLSKAVGELLPGFLAARRKWAESQRQSADEFNLLEVMGADGDEVCHSKILAWLLDHRIEHGTHAQGNLGF